MALGGFAFAGKLCSVTFRTFSSENLLGNASEVSRNSDNLLCIENVRSSELETSDSSAPALFPRSNQVNLAEAPELRN